MFDLSILNKQQKEAVVATEGRIKVVAGAGSGKTRVLATRYAYLVEMVGIDPGNILCATFTNKAAQEMKNRIAKMIGNVGHVNDYVCTIYGFCVKLLRRDIFRLGIPKNFIILDEEDAKILAKQTMEEMELDRTKITVGQFLDNISLTKCRNGYQYVENYLINPKQEFLDSELYRYTRKQLQNFALDFDDLLLLTLYLLETFEEVREFWQEEFNYIQVDEVQDCNQSDWRIIEILQEKHGNLFVVGDPDQAIYEWRGSMPEYFINMAADATIILDENYRSTPNILEVANQVIKGNHNRIDKKLFTSKPPECLAAYFHAPTEKEESEWVVSQILELKEKGVENEDFAILYRASYLSRSVEQALMNKSVPYVVWGGVRFFERREIKDILAYMRLVSQRDDLSFERIINVPSRKFGKVKLERLRKLAKEEKSSLFDTLERHQNDSDFKKASIRNFIGLINNYSMMQSAMRVSDIADGLLRESGLKEDIRGDEDEDRLENLSELLSSIRLYEEEHLGDNVTLDSYLQDIALYTNADYRKAEGTVKLMTIHQAKGLEFGYVFVIGMTEGIFPNHKSIRERKRNGEEEERRLMYVAITRAEKALFLTESEGYSQTTHTSKYPSRFLVEIGSKLLKVEGKIDPQLFIHSKQLVEELNQEITKYERMAEFCEGAQVNHPIFGDGVIESVNEERESCTVYFAEITRSLMWKVLTLKK